MLKINWKDQSSNWDREEEVANMQEAVENFRATLKGVYAHGGGYVQILDADNTDVPLIQWTVGASGGFVRGYVTGQAVIDYHPEEDLGVCENETCEAHDDQNQGLCESCEIACREMCLDRLLMDKSYN